jgi:hypothetical protein
MWQYQQQEQTAIPQGKIGFVYLIVNQVTGKKYIGKKNYFTTRTRTLKGKKKRTTSESDWLEYFGSNDELKADVEAMGAENFQRTILHQCSTKGAMNYLELKEQIDRRVLERADYYNSWVMCRINKSHLKSLT